MGDYEMSTFNQIANLLDVVSLWASTGNDIIVVARKGGSIRGGTPWVDIPG